MRWLAAMTAVSAGTGVLLSVPPLSFFIFPVYSRVYVIHGWFSLAVAVPFFIGVLAHGLPAWQTRGWSPFTCSGICLAVAFAASLATGVYSMRTDVVAPWVLFAHIAAGIVAFVTTFVHAPRFWLRAPRRGESL